ncbi:hypothetical protein K1719_008187 [Acacia pycnantha]|nr:hypothetical protein K1719_008187 [Acacia pycnantha]
MDAEEQLDEEWEDKGMVPPHVLVGRRIAGKMAFSVLSVSIPASDDFEGMKKSWEDFYAFGNRGYSRGRREPDTFTLRGLPSRWFYS